MAGITTHILDSERGRPAPGVRIDFSVMEEGRWRLVKSVVTNADGRTDTPILPAAEAKIGQYQLEFFIDGYLKSRPGVSEADIFVDNPGGAVRGVRRQAALPRADAVHARQLHHLSRKLTMPERVEIYGPIRIWIA